MKNKEVIWKRNDASGKNGYIGSIRIGSYHFNGVDSKNGQYKVSSLMPQSTVKNAYAKDEAEAMQIIITEFDEFMNKLTK